MVGIKHGGDIYRNEILHDFSINLNPLGMPEAVKEALRGSIDHWDRYPDPECEALTRRLAVHHQVRADQILCGNGAADLIYQLVQSRRPKKSLLTAPTFSEYRQALEMVSCETCTCFLEEKTGFHIDIDQLIKQITSDTEILFFCNPNNPTGIPVPKKEIEKLAKACHQTGTFLVLDECFCEFLDEPERYSMISEVDKFPEMMILKAFTTTYSMAGVRLGYAICADHQVIEKMQHFRQPWSVSVPAQEAGAAALLVKGYLEETRQLLRKERNFLKQELISLGCVVYESEANYLFFRVPREEKQREETASLYELCRQRKILIRDCRNYEGLGRGFYRICVRTSAENQILIRQLKETFGTV